MHVLYSGPAVSSSPPSLPLSALTLRSSDALSADHSQDVDINYGVVSFVLPRTRCINDLGFRAR